LCAHSSTPPGDQLFPCPRRRHLPRNQFHQPHPLAPSQQRRRARVQLLAAQRLQPDRRGRQLHPGRRRRRAPGAEPDRGPAGADPGRHHPQLGSGAVQLRRHRVLRERAGRGPGPVRQRDGGRRRVPDEHAGGGAGGGRDLVERQGGGGGGGQVCAGGRIGGRGGLAVTGLV
jgi:hypothetical protein